MANDTPMYDTPADDTQMDNANQGDSTESGKTSEQSGDTSQESGKTSEESGGAYSGNETPAQELERLNKELKEKLDDQAGLGKDIDQLKAEIAELNKTVADIDQKIKAWEKASVTIKEQQKTQQTYFDREKKELEATLSANDQKLVKDAQAKGKKQVDDLKAQVKALAKTVSDKKSALADAGTKKAEKAQAYKNEVDLATKDNDLLKDLATIHTDADKEEAKNNVRRQYFLILEGADDLGNLDVPDVKAYAARLNKAGTEVADASDAERAAKEALDKAQVELQAAQKNLSDAEKNRRANTLSSIPENKDEVEPS